MSDKNTSKPQKKGIARPTRRGSKAPSTPTISKNPALRKSSRTQAADAEDDNTDTQQPQKAESGNKQSRKSKTKSILNTTAEDAEDDDQPEEDEAEDKRLPTSKSKLKSLSKKATDISKDTEVGDTPLYNRAYVDAHKDTEDFHHRGNGRWSRGLPGPNANVMSAVVGPGAEAWKAARK
ncbi:hypothetical protein CLAFUW4_06862 [Fulvia fulva]|uniref:Uncharacterized protein n=1 Tax=Passalora fulva TaxID=5499 RepID=A0A9Q8UR46_PASFU|nr:uncharacterized protein CLAFUR5_07000 [Fulvia fulva]KAK4621375.1 hypothetical protein CLAFUR4_06870 [Fulvia fulva]KAK4622887.1 hypothetical protein CLAFUR0_06867 [Fulvia fulva]UJO19419.1 hypothetical protein CLAFUR5_07000 [Fulvia fulva]WPV15674.1 hypothetical protein CLAFUW4_06862 [Fulvia fulva]WPV31454.1 hypothetical protein CLAFUW7_06861 [Fulvia fulva]